MLAVDIALSMFFGAIVIASGLWLFGLFHMLSRGDLNKSKLLWFILFIFLSIFGSWVYFFSENRTRLGWISVIVFICSVCCLFVALFLNPDIQNIPSYRGR